MTNLDHALACIARGWPIFPTRITKAPYTQQGFKDASTDEAQVRRWWTTWPQAGIGLATGARSGLWVLDVDPDKGGLISLEALQLEHGLLPDTLRSKTGGGGWHWFWTMPAPVRNRGGFAPGLDVRGEGGYVVLPPSLHESGGSYAWEIEADPVEAPEWLLAMVTRSPNPPSPSERKPREPVRNPRAYGAAALAGACAQVSSAAPGTRNSALNEAAFAMREKIEQGYVTRDRVETDLQLAGEAAGLPSAEVRKTLASGLGAAREPSQAAEPSAEVEVCPSGDPMTVARHILRAWTDDRQRQTLRRWREQWHRYDGSCYRAVASEDFEAEVWTILGRLHVRGKDGPSPFNPSISKVSNVSKALLAQGLLVDSDAEPPVWVAGHHAAHPRHVAVVSNGLLDLRTETLEESTPDLFATTAVATPWLPNASRPARWLDFLDSVFGSDIQAIALLQEWFGYCLASDTSQQKMLFLVGPRRCGKGTICRTLTALLGKQAVAAPTLASLSESFGLEPLLGKSVAIIADARLSQKTDQAQIVERLLSISGEDSLTVNRKNRSQVTTRIAARMTICSNEIPRLSDASGALPSRMLVASMPRSFYGVEDHGLEAALSWELSSILAWAVEGWQHLHERGRFVTPEQSEELVRSMERIAGPVGAFVEDECDTSDHEAWIEMRTLYERYVAWCRDQGLVASSRPVFGRDLRSVVTQLVTTRPRSGNPDRVERYIGITTRVGGHS